MRVRCYVCHKDHSWQGRLPVIPDRVRMNPDNWFFRAGNATCWKCKGWTPHQSYRTAEVDRQIFEQRYWHWQDLLQRNTDGLFEKVYGSPTDPFATKLAKQEGNELL